MRWLQRKYALRANGDGRVITSSELDPLVRGSSLFGGHAEKLSELESPRQMS